MASTRRVVAKALIEGHQYKDKRFRLRVFHCLHRLIASLCLASWYRGRAPFASIDNRRILKNFRVRALQLQKQKASSWRLWPSLSP